MNRYKLFTADPPPSPSGTKRTTSPGRPPSALYRTVEAAKPGQAFLVPPGDYASPKAARDTALRTAARLGRKVATRIVDDVVTVYVTA
ncbi:MAG: hypothetical protein AAF845_05570 [Bacteroidota bacterium]